SVYMSVSRILCFFFFFFSSRRRHTRSKRDWSSDVCSSDLLLYGGPCRNADLVDWGPCVSRRRRCHCCSVVAFADHSDIPGRPATHPCSGCLWHHRGDRGQLRYGDRWCVGFVGVLAGWILPQRAPGCIIGNRSAAKAAGL